MWLKNSTLFSNTLGQAIEGIGRFASMWWQAGLFVINTQLGYL
jgi:hypothetical protein